MRVPSPTTGTTNRSRTAAAYLQPATPNFSGLVQGVDALGNAVTKSFKDRENEAKQNDLYEANARYVEFNAQSAAQAERIARESHPDDPTLKDRIESQQYNFEQEFISSLPPELQERFKVSVAETRVRIRGQTSDQVNRTADNAERFKTTEQFAGFINEATNAAKELTDQAEPGDETLADRIKADYQARKAEYLKTVPDKLKNEFEMRFAESDISLANGADAAQKKGRQVYQSDALNRMQSEAKDTITVDPDSLEGQKAIIDETIDHSDFTETEKFLMKQKAAADLEKTGYTEVLKRQKVKTTSYMGELVQGTQRLSQKYGLPAKDFLTVFSYETGGTFAVDQAGGKNNAHLGLIQFGPAEQKKYGIHKGMSVSEHLDAVDRYLTDRGFKPGMSLIDLYSTINAGSPGRNNTSDANNGGAPGTVADKVTDQMGAHAAKAESVLANDTTNAPRLPVKSSGGDIANVDPKVLDAYERLQGAFGQQILVKSGFRDPNKNADVGGAKHSQHIEGTALDLETGDMSHAERLRLIKMASAMGFTGIGVYANNIHLDMRAGPPKMWGPTHSADSVPAWAYAAGIEHRARKGGSQPDGLPADFSKHKANGVLAVRGKFAPPDNLDEDPRFINVPFEDRTAIRNTIDGEVARLQAAQATQQEDARKATVDALYNNLFDGKAGLADIDEAMKTGLLTTFEERKKAVGIVEEREKTGLVERKAVERLANGNMFDITNSDDNKALNTLYGDKGTTAINQRNQNYVQQGLIPLVEKAGAIPPDAVGTLTTMSRSTDGRNMVFALQTLNALEDLNPSVYGAQVTPAVRHKADLYEALVGTMPDKQLIEMLSDAPTSQERNDREAYRKQAEEMLQPNSPTPVRFADQFGEIDGAPLTPTTVQATTEWNTLFVEAMARTRGNQEASVGLANKQFSRVWKKTQIDGVDALMKYPPELYSPTIGSDHSWMTKQLRGELGLTDAQRVFVVSDATTAKEVAMMHTPTAGGRAGPSVGPSATRPSYRVFVQKEDGSLDFVRGESGRPLRHVFTPSEDDMAQHELDLRIKSKKVELETIMKIMSPGPGTALMGVPDEITKRGADLAKEIETLRSRAQQKAVETENSYKSPAQKELSVQQAKWDELISDIGTWTGPIEEWPRYKELEAVDKALEAAKPLAEKEAEAQRKRIGE
jgi:hypothetical protein